MSFVLGWADLAIGVGSEFGELPLAVQVTIYMVDPAQAATEDEDIFLVGTRIHEIFYAYRRCQWLYRLRLRKKMTCRRRGYEIANSAARNGFFLVLVLIVIAIATMAVYSFTDLMLAYDDSASVGVTLYRPESM